MFMIGLTLSRLGLSPNEIEAELNAVVGTEPHMRKRIPGVTKILAKIWAFVGADLWGPIERLI